MRRVLIALMAGVWMVCGALAVDAAPRLNKVSFAERSDGKGYVVRFHSTERLRERDVKMRRTDAGTLEVTLNRMRLGRGFQEMSAQGPVTSYTVRQRRQRVVVTFKLDPMVPVTEVSYPDAASRDYLLALNYSDAAPVRTTPAARPQLPVIKTSDSPELTQEHWRLDCVVVDAGHGGHDGGARANGVREKDVNLSIALRLGDLIESQLGIRVVYTRKDDTFLTLEKRGQIANEKCGKLFISIHANAARSRAKGTETYFLGLHKSDTARDVMERENSVVQLEENPELTALTKNDIIIKTIAQSAYQMESELLAGLVEREFGQTNKRPSRGVKQAGFIVLWQASMPAILVETGFLTNRTEAKYLKSKTGQDEVAASIFRAVRAFKQEYENSLRPAAE
ncbi:MAG: N-acetylmuramoyl-L-alanine amidase [Bacteroidota bacterium]